MKKTFLYRMKAKDFFTITRTPFSNHLHLPESTSCAYNLFAKHSPASLLNYF